MLQPIAECSLNPCEAAKINRRCGLFIEANIGEYYLKRFYARWNKSSMTHHWPVRDNLRLRGSASSPHPRSTYCSLPKPPLPTEKPCSTRCTRRRFPDWQSTEKGGYKMSYVAVALRESPANSLQDSLSVGPPHFASSWSKPGDKRTHIHPQHCGRTPPSCPVEKKSMTVLMLRPLSGAPSLSRQASIPVFYSRLWCPYRAVLSCFGVNPTGCSVHSALQGRRGLTSPRQRLTGGQ